MMKVQETKNMVRIPKKEYEQLSSVAERYASLERFFAVGEFMKSPIKDTGKAIKEMRATGLYKEAFLKSLERGLKESHTFGD